MFYGISVCHYSVEYHAQSRLANCSHSQQIGVGSIV